MSESDNIYRAGMRRLRREFDLTEGQLDEIPEDLIRAAGIREVQQHAEDRDDDYGTDERDLVIDSLGGWESQPIAHEIPGAVMVSPDRAGEGSTVSIVGPNIGQEPTLMMVDLQPTQYQFRSPHLVRLPLRQVKGKAYTVAWSDEPIQEGPDETFTIDITGIRSALQEQTGNQD
jgi:hypothetical protein